MPSHMLYETHPFPKTAFDILVNFLRFDILSQNPMHFCISIEKSNAFFPYQISNILVEISNIMV